MMLPKLPGYTPTHDFDKPSFHRTSFQQQECPKTQGPALIYREAAEELAQKNATVPPVEHEWTSTTHAVFANPLGEAFDSGASDAREPALAAFREAVLCFTACFFEKVVGSGSEQDRVRRVNIQCYVADNTFTIIERPQRNSGMQHGALLRRCVVPGPEGTPLTPTELRVGAAVEIFATRYLLHGCDRFTREFYCRVGVEQPADFDIALDASERAALEAFAARQGAGLNSSLHNGRVPSHRKFLENDRKVLRFYAAAGEEAFALQYYLADDTLELRGLRAGPRGQGESELLMRRQRAPKQVAVGLPGIAPDGEVFTVDDFRPGAELRLLSRDLRLGECDAFTQAYMREQRGLEFPLRQAVAEPPRSARPAKPPGQPGFFELMDDAGELCFHARLRTARTEDALRRFFITFYLGSRTLSVHEQQLRNSGFEGKKFLERGVYAGEGGAPIEPADLLIGKLVTINSHLFEIVGSDARTADWVRETFALQMTPLE